MWPARQASFMAPKQEQSGVPSAQAVGETMKRQLWSIKRPPTNGLIAVHSITVVSIVNNFVVTPHMSSTRPGPVLSPRDRDPVARPTWRLDYPALALYMTAGYVRMILEVLSRFKALKHITAVLDETTERRMVDRLKQRQGEDPLVQGIYDGQEFLPAVPFLTSLRTLDLATDIFQLDNESLTVSAQSVVHLEVLKMTPSLPLMTGYCFSQNTNVHHHWLNGGGTSNIPLADNSLPTLDGLIPLVEHCDRLATLKIAVQARLCDGKRRERVADRPNDSIRTLELWATPLDHLSDDVFVDFFALTFPALETFRVVLPNRSVPKNVVYETTPREEACRRWDKIAAALSDRVQGLRVLPTTY
ncbi:hypothetical protein BV20DRAFT_1119887 [Pilatotrama ljubarskyi]|nr:hypothetical protein BV20DRAFT_1119887 [Pilatotrama ljubarskyi]